MLRLRRGITCIKNILFWENLWIVNQRTHRMSNATGHNGSDHLEKTAGEVREKGVSEAEVVELHDISPTVKKLLLKVTDTAFSFKAGQWVDFIVTGVDVFTGFSMSSPPSLLQSGNLELAVQISEHPPTLWVHKECKIGSKVSLRVGGTQMVYDPHPDDPRWNVLLIAGGIGINPILSMMRHAAELQSTNSTRSYTTGSFKLLYSVSKKSELIFQDSILEIVKSFPSVFQSQFFITKDDVSTDKLYTHGRIQDSDLASAVSELSADNLKCYVCGPPPMIEDIQFKLLSLNVKPSNLHYEKWW